MFSQYINWNVSSTQFLATADNLALGVILSLLALCVLAGLSVITLACIKLWPILEAGLVVSLRYAFAHADLDIQARQVELEQARAKALQDSIVKLDQGQTAISERPNLKEVGHNPTAQTNPKTLDPSGLVPHSVWFPEVVNGLHVITVGETGSGKSTLAEAIAYECHKQGDDVRIITPHGRPSDWFGFRVIGAGRNYTAINKALKDGLTEMSARYKLYDAGQDDFEWVTYIIDETTAIAKKCESWLDFFGDISCEGRKVNMRIVVLIHGKQVKTLGLEGQSDLKENFQFIYLGRHAVKALPASKQMDYPAVVEVNGELSLIDNTKLPEIASQPTVYNSPKPFKSESQPPETTLQDEDEPKPDFDPSELLKELPNDRERTIASLLFTGMNDTAIAKHLSGGYQKNLDQIKSIRQTLNGRLPV